MPLNKDEIRIKVKNKILEARNNKVSADEALDNLIDAFLIIIDEVLVNAVVTGACPPNGGLLVNGKIT